MKRIALAVAAAALAACGAANAADMPVKAFKAPIAPVAAYSWTGCFIGVAGGGIIGSSRHISGAPGTVGTNITDRYDLTGGIVGAEYGCNYQLGSFVLGTESDISWTSLRGRASDIPPFNTTSLSGTRERWLSTTRARVGYLVTPMLLLYGTGGLADARVQAFVDATASGLGTISESRIRWGWTGGGGAEYAFGNGWSMKADYLYVRLNDKGYFNAPPPGFSQRLNVPVWEHVFRVGVNYKYSNCILFVFGCS